MRAGLENALVALGCPERPCPTCHTSARGVATLTLEVWPYLVEDEGMMGEPNVIGIGGRLVESREERYGHPAKQWDRAARLFTAILNGKLSSPIEPHEVGLLMIGWKLSRLCSSPDDQDSLHDLAGYAAALEVFHGREPTV